MNITITEESYNDLLDSYKKLKRLEEAGVDNWDGYSYALRRRKGEPFTDEDEAYDFLLNNDDISIDDRKEIFFQNKQYITKDEQLAVDFLINKCNYKTYQPIKL